MLVLEDRDGLPLSVAVTCEVGTPANPPPEAWSRRDVCQRLSLSASRMITKARKTQETTATATTRYRVRSEASGVEGISRLPKSANTSGMLLATATVQSEIRGVRVHGGFKATQISQDIWDAVSHRHSECDSGRERGLAVVLNCHHQALLERISVQQGPRSAHLSCVQPHREESLARWP
ncbi:hypothetical protein QTO34_016170 [Cnephaeus nilssonii]|uniref:Uncharacterized protein n=1 Tax=Cnephaeus nilssonii TaxID=3371016 RepID=A0AA40I5H4_CNENI|nr:hypothetical protein QTO34_016170 [Eptesicus nilssonii]